MKINSFLIWILLPLFLFSCGNRDEENHGGDGMMQDGMMSEEMRNAMMSRGMGPEMMEDMWPIRQMLMNHEQIERRVEDLPDGVKTWTTSDDPAIATAIQKHVRQMKERMEEDKPIRQMDPLFRELFQHADKIDMQIEDLENGVLVVETSADPQVVKLIRQHAHRAVSEFAEHGMQRAMQPRHFTVFTTRNTFFFRNPSRIFERGFRKKNVKEDGLLPALLV